jgi:hypothetical protein
MTKYRAYLLVLETAVFSVTGTQFVYEARRITAHLYTCIQGYIFLGESLVGLLY